MGKLTKVKSVQGNGTYDGQHGTLYKFEYEFEDGQSLVANHKTPDGNFKVGQDVEYEVKGTNSYGSWGSVKKPMDNPLKPNNNFINQAKTPEEKTAIQKAIIYQSAFKEAVGYHNIVGFHTGEANSFKEMCSTADAIAKYVIEKSGV